MLTLFLITLLVPLFLFVSLALQRQASVLQFALSALALGLAVLFMWLALPWDVVSIYYRWLVPLFFLGALYLGYQRIGSAKKQPGKWARRLNVLVNLTLIVMFAGLSWRALIGYPAPQNAISLQSPLLGGSFVVGHGGASPFINAHARVVPQNFALDILGVNSWGSRSNIFGNENDLYNYAIYGAEIVAPCDGTIMLTRDGLPDLKPGDSDRENLAGNFVVLTCLDTEIVMAHMQPGSITVKPNDKVKVGDLLGNVGNSGNTSEPHLHIHAERGGFGPDILNGEGVPMLIEGRWLVRGDSLD